MKERALEAIHGISEGFESLVIGHAEAIVRQTPTSSQTPEIVTDAHVRAACEHLVEHIDIEGAWRAWTGDVHPFDETDLHEEMKGRGIQPIAQPRVTNMAIEDERAIPLLEEIRMAIGGLLRGRLKRYVRMSAGGSAEPKLVEEKDVVDLVDFVTGRIDTLLDETKRLLVKSFCAAEKQWTQKQQEPPPVNGDDC